MRLSFEYVSRVNSWYLKNDQEKFTNSCKYIEGFSRYFGYLLGKKLLLSSVPLSDYDRNYWGRMLKEQHFGTYNVPDESVDNFSWHRCKVYLGYTISLILDGNKDLFEKYYLESNDYYLLGDSFSIIYRLVVACYLYYLSDVESLSLVPPKAKECADTLLGSKDR